MQGQLCAKQCSMLSSTGVWLVSRRVAAPAGMHVVVSTVSVG